MAQIIDNRQARTVVVERKTTIAVAGVGVQGQPGPAAFPDAPHDGKSYVRKNGAWVEAVFGENPETYYLLTGSGDTLTTASGDRLLRN